RRPPILIWPVPAASTQSRVADPRRTRDRSRWRVTAARRTLAAVPEYCVGMAMAIDWGEGDEPQCLDRGLARRVLAYFRPYWRAGALALVCIAAGALLGLVPALVFRSLIDYLGRA